MSDQDEAAVEAAESPAETATSLPGVDHVAAKVEEPQRANREARYRVERNEARAALEAANARIEALLCCQVERLASQHLAEPADVFTVSGKSVQDFLGQDGDLDEELVLDTVKGLLAERPGLRKALAHDPSQGLGGNPKPKQELSWKSLFQH